MTQRSGGSGHSFSNGNGCTQYNGPSGELTATVNELWVGGSDPKALARFGLA